MMPKGYTRSSRDSARIPFYFTPSVNKWESVSSRSRSDLLIRLVKEAEKVEIFSIPTQYAQAAIQNHFQRLTTTNRILIEALQGCRHYLDYTGYYIAFLLGQSSEEEFEKISEQYIPQFSIPKQELEDKIEVLFRETGMEFSSIELAAIFSAPKNQIDQALKLLSTQGKLVLTDEP